MPSNVHGNERALSLSCELHLLTSPSGIDTTHKHNASATRKKKKKNSAPTIHICICNCLEHNIYSIVAIYSDLVIYMLRSVFVYMVMAAAPHRGITGMRFNLP